MAKLTLQEQLLKAGTSHQQKSGEGRENSEKIACSGA
ncbi:Uncharacterised protein [Escherichia coli]|nr:Uncharacterised protein [Escherichia coli]